LTHGVYSSYANFIRFPAFQQSCAVLLVFQYVYVFQQDTAPANRARDTVQLLQQESPEFITLDLWPTDSPDLNPVNYRGLGVMQERVYKTALRDIADLKQRLVETWSSIPQTVIDEAIDEWRLRLQACAKTLSRLWIMGMVLLTE